MKDNTKTGGSKREQIDEGIKISKAACSALITGATASGITAAAMLTGKVLIKVGPFVLKTVSNLSVPKIIITGISAAAGAGLIHYTAQSVSQMEVSSLAVKDSLTDEDNFTDIVDVDFSFE